MADPGLLTTCLAALLAVAPPAGATATAPVRKDMPTTPAEPGPGDMPTTPAEPGPGDMPTTPADAPGAPDLSPRPADDPDAPPTSVEAPPAPPPPTAVEGPASAPTLAPATPPATPPPTGACHGSRPCRRLVILGSVSGALGLASVIAGAVLTARPIAADPDDPTMAITYRPAGTAVLTIGIGVLATSLLMTLAAVRASRQARRSAVAHRSLRPAL